MSGIDARVESEVKKLVDDYHLRFMSPTARTVQKWRKTAENRILAKGQLVLPFAEEELQFEPVSDISGDSPQQAQGDGPAPVDSFTKEVPLT